MAVTRMQISLRPCSRNAVDRNMQSQCSWLASASRCDAPCSLHVQSVPAAHPRTLAACFEGTEEASAATTGAVDGKGKKCTSSAAGIRAQVRTPAPRGGAARPCATASHAHRYLASVQAAATQHALCPGPRRGRRAPQRHNALTECCALRVSSVRGVWPGLPGAALAGVVMGLPPLMSSTISSASRLRSPSGRKGLSQPLSVLQHNEKAGSEKQVEASLAAVCSSTWTPLSRNPL